MCVTDSHTSVSTGQQQSPLSQRPRVGGLDATLSGVLHSRAMSKPPLFLFIGILSGKGFR